MLFNIFLKHQHKFNQIRLFTIIQSIRSFNKRIIYIAKVHEHSNRIRKLFFPQEIVIFDISFFVPKILHNT